MTLWCVICTLLSDAGQSSRAQVLCASSVLHDASFASALGKIDRLRAAQRSNRVARIRALLKPTLSTRESDKPAAKRLAQPIAALADELAYRTSQR